MPERRRALRGADLENIINEAALRAVRAGKVRVSQQELDEAIEVIIAGEEKKNRVMSNEEKKIVAYHETGACAGYLPAHAYGAGA